ncbi:MAG: choice-of-anchor D domain-containing protein [Deltaproteobacteria bacterium]|nr:choice-of-anchor D domain-containing protein [Deltaproteobacteria bacterium]
MLTTLGLLVLACIHFIGCQDAEPLSPYEAGLLTQPQELVFSTSFVGAEIVRNLVVGNDGNAPLSLDAYSIGDEAADGLHFRMVSQGEFPLGAGQTTSIVVAFAPSEAGAHATSLKLQFAGFAEVEVPISGLAQSPALRIEPPVVEWSELNAGDTASQEVLLINEDDVDLDVSLSFSGASVFQMSTSSGGTTSQRSLTLEPNESLPLTLYFSPPGAGLSSATLFADVCGEGCGATAQLLGTGLAPRIQVNPRQVNFGDVQVGETTTVTVDLSNIGVGNLNVTRISIDDDLGFATVSTPSLPAISTDGNASFDVQFAPTSPQADFSANLILESNDPLQPRLLLPVRANVPGALVRAFPAVLQLGYLDVGDARQADTLIRSVGDAPVTVTAVILEAEGTNAFRITSPIPALPRDLAPQEGFIVTIEAVAGEDDFLNLGANGNLLFRTSEGDFRVPLEFSTDVSRCRPRANRSHVDLGFLQPGLGARGVTEIVNEGIALCTLERVVPTLDHAFDTGFTFATDGTTLLNPGESMQVEFAFSTVSQGGYRAFLSLDFAESERPVVVSASVSTTPRNLVAEPSSIQVGPFREGCTMPNTAFTLLNSGAAAANVVSVLATPNAPVAFISPNLDFWVEPGGAVTVSAGLAQMPSPGLHTGAFVVEVDQLPQLSVNLEVEVVPAGEPILERFLVPNDVDELDVLFIVDNSGSMYDDQVELASNFGRFIDAARQQSSGLDVHLAATTTDIFVEAGELIGTPPFLPLFSSSTPGLFANRVNVGTMGSGLELGLEATYLALGPDAPLRNRGFLRPNAALSVVVVSDEEDSGAWEGLEYTIPVQRYIDFLRSVKSSSNSEIPVLFSAVTVPGAARYLEMVTAFNGIFLDINAPWGEDLGLIGEASANLRKTLRLESVPAGDVQVYVNGVLVENYSISGSVVTFTDSLPAGGDVRVSYVPTCN